MTPCYTVDGDSLAPAQPLSLCAHVSLSLRSPRTHFSRRLSTPIADGIARGVGAGVMGRRRTCQAGQCGGGCPRGEGDAGDEERTARECDVGVCSSHIVRVVDAKSFANVFNFRGSSDKRLLVLTTGATHDRTYHDAISQFAGHAAAWAGLADRLQTPTGERGGVFEPSLQTPTGERGSLLASDPVTTRFVAGIAFVLAACGTAEVRALCQRAGLRVQSEGSQERVTLSKLEASAEPVHYDPGRRVVQRERFARVSSIRTYRPNIYADRQERIMAEREEEEENEGTETPASTDTIRWTYRASETARTDRKKADEC